MDVFYRLAKENSADPNGPYSATATANITSQSVPRIRCPVSKDWKQAQGDELRITSKDPPKSIVCVPLSS